MSGATKRTDADTLEYVKRTPADVLAKAMGRVLMIELPAMRGSPAIMVTPKVLRFVKTSLHTTDPEVADVRHGIVKAHVLQFFESVRSGPAALSSRALLAISKDVYDHIVELHADNPGSADNWSAMKGFNRAVKEGRIAVAPELRPNDRAANEIEAARVLFGIDLTAGINARKVADPELAALESRFGLMATWVLQRRGLEIDAASRRLLLQKIEHASTLAFTRLKRHANDDYTPDSAEASFPRVEASKPSVMSIWSLYDSWAAERDPEPSTKASYRTAVAEFVAFLGHDDAVRVTPQNVVAWKDRMLTDGVLSHRTVGDVKLAAVKSIFRLAAKNHRIASNPGQGITVERRAKVAEKMKGHRDEDVKVILRAALRQTRPLLKWVPWLICMTGARVGEACRLRVEDIRQEDGVWVADFASKTEAGERTVPLHWCLTERGFIEFVRSRKTGYLFFDGRRVRANATAKPGKSAANDVREFIKGLGLNVGLDQRIAPAHGFRHLFTTMARRVGIDSEKREAMLGHELGGERGTYGTMAGLAVEIAKLPDPLTGTLRAFLQ